METVTTQRTAAGDGALGHFVGGAYLSGGNRTFENRNPVDGSLVGHVTEAGGAEVDAAVAAARAALGGPWRRLAAADRARVLHRVADGIEARFDAFLAAEVRDTGKPNSLAALIDIPRGAANFRVFADLIKNAGDEVFAMATPDGTGAINYGVRVPKGVIAVICPWNLPLLLMTWKVAPALACGNAVVVKPSEETPTTATLLGEVMNAAGVPPGVYNVIHGFGPDSAGELLTRHAGIDAITFTGETRTGEAIMKAAAVGVRDVSMELGGKNPAIVFADANLDHALEGTTRSTFANCGQVCLGTERVYVERAVFAEFVARLKTAAERLRPGRPEAAETTLGPLISQQHRDKVLGYYQRARAEGAEVITGGGIPDMPAALAGGSWIQPTIWTGLPEDSAIVRDEIFGPCCHVRPFDDEDEAIALANDTLYGLCCSVWTQNLARAHRVAARMDVGLCWVNSWFLRDLRTPFGGAKRSGIGREGGMHSLAFYTELRNVCIKL
ncbi:MAG: 2-hydroxymuconic semialdehyde dehydrogenase [Alphaproteobacteria bacterium]|nr:2-hydroxymuconic semialdehyde dehydrogenase [Alphaproteobacteria bacterium]